MMAVKNHDNVVTTDCDETINDTDDGCMFEERNNCFLVKACVNNVELLSVRDTGNFRGILVSSFKCGTANLQRQRRPYGVWILQRD